MAHRHSAARTNRTAVQPGGRAEVLSTPPARPRRRTSAPPLTYTSGWFRIPRGRLSRPEPPPSAAWSALLAFATLGLLLLVGSLINR